MYYQLFIKKTKQQTIPSQISCDDWNEVQQEIERLNRPKYVTVEYDNQDGLYGIAVKEYDELNEVYITISKKKLEKSC